MKQFTVPQFIDVEDKIIGPITVRQFIIMIIGGLILFIEYKLSDLVLFILLAIPTFAIFGTVAFLKINGMPFHYFLLNVIQTFKKPKLRVWLREVQVSSVKMKEEVKTTALAPLPAKRPITRSRLSDISLIIDTGGIYRGKDLGTEGFL